jgi:sodium transport system permease protein
VNAFAVVFAKEWKDAIRDRRTWVIVLTTSILAGPVLLFLLSTFIAGIEESAARREVFVDNAATAPTLVNFMQRAGGNVRDAPADYREQIKSGRMQNAVVIVPPDFEARLAAGDTISIDVVFDDTATKAQPSIRATLAIVRAFNRELGTQRLLARGVSPHLLTPIEVQEQNLASSQARGAQMLFLVPWMALMAAVIGALSVAIDVTAGERERGSLEPLLMNPVSTAALVFGKWAVVALCSATVVVLTLAGFKTAMQFIRSETLAALMQFGFAETALFIVMLLPFSAMVASINMLAATYGRSHKEAQTYASYITIFVNIAPIVPLFLAVRDAHWQLFVPAMAQQTVMMRSLRGDAVGAVDILLPGAIALLATAAALVLQAQLLRNERIIFSRSA